MNILWISAHPEPRSLNGHLAQEVKIKLRAEGHSVADSDLYEMGWNPVVDAASYGHDETDRFQVATAASSGYLAGLVAPDIRAEQAKIDAADTIIVQFPMWWFGMPAILKGWFDRVWHLGYAYGHRGPNGEWIGYGDGFLAGKRAIVVTTMGGPDWMYGDRGIHGSIEDLLFPIQHGLFFYAGAAVLPPMLLAGADRFTDQDAEQAVADLHRRIVDSPTAAPIPYRHGNSDDYENFILRDGLAPGVGGTRKHQS